MRWTGSTRDLANLCASSKLLRLRMFSSNDGTPKFEGCSPWYGSAHIMSTLLNRCASICRSFDRLVTYVIYASTLALRVCYGIPRASWIRPTGDSESRGRPPWHTLIELRQAPFVVGEIRGGRLCEGWCYTEIIAMGLSYASTLMDETSERERLANR